MAKRKNIKWTTELDARLMELRKANVKPSIISTIMDVPVTCIYNRSFALNLTKKGSGSLPIDLPVYEDDAPAGVDVGSIAFNLGRAPQYKPKPTWWKQMMWWRN